MSANPKSLGSYDVERVWRDFPILARQVHGKPLVFLDSAASSQRPASVIAAVDAYEKLHHANVHRGVHQLSQEATAMFEHARERVRGFVNAASTREVIFTRGTTESINLVAQSYARPRLKPGDEILLTALEHHANIVPWQLVAEQTGAVVRAVPMDRRGVVSLEDVAANISERTRIVACAHVSNALGTVLPVREIARLAHARGAVLLVDGAQAVPHQRVDLAKLDCDFYAFSAHKMFGPTGIGVLYGRSSLLDAMPPYQGGGEMISAVTFEKTTYQAPPHRFEAGTPAIAQAVGLAAAIRYLDALDFNAVVRFEHELLVYATAALSSIRGLRIVGIARHKGGILSFVLDGVHPHDVASILDREGVAVRAGHHCCQPLMARLGLPATVRASFAVYTIREEIDALVAGLHRVREIFR